MKKEYQATNYESDLTDKQWEAIKEFFPSGNKSKYHKRSLVEAVLYIVKTGCQWRMLPHDYPPHDTVWSFYRRARENGVWDKMMKHLVKITRKQAGRNEEPSYALIDSQSVKTTCYGENHGYDGGRKRHIVTDTMGNLLCIYVHAANIHDTKGGVYTFEKALYRYPTIQAGCADGGYRGTFRNTFDEFHNIRIDISMQIKEQKGFQVLPKRWVVERTFAWLNGSRRLSKDYETSCCSAETMIIISHVANMSVFT